MFILVVTIHVIVSLVIIGLVLLQAGKGADIGSAFGGSGSQAVFGSMGTPTVLGKATAVVAVVFMITSFALSIMSHQPRDVASCPRRRPRRPRRDPGRAPGAPAAVPAPRFARSAEVAAGPNAETGARSLPAGLGRLRSARGGLQRADREPVGGRAGGGKPARLRRHVHPGVHRRHRRADPEPDLRRVLARGRRHDLRRAGQARPGPQDGPVHGGIVDLQPRLPRADLQAAAGREVARRPAVHGRRRALHLPGHDQSEDPGAVQGGLPAREGRAGPRSLHGAGDLRQALRAGARDVEHLHAAQAPPAVVRGGGHAARVAPEQPSDRHRPLPLPGMEAGREGGAGRQPGLLRGPAVPEPHRLPRHPEPGHHLSRAEGPGRRLREQPHRHPVRAADRVPRLPEGVPQVPLSRERLHLLRLQPQGPSVRGPRGFARRSPTRSTSRS